MTVGELRVKLAQYADDLDVVGYLCGRAFAVTAVEIDLYDGGPNSAQLVWIDLQPTRKSG